MGKSAKFTKRLTKKEKDNLRIARQSGTDKPANSKPDGYIHDTKATMKAATKALGASIKSSSSTTTPSVKGSGPGTGIKVTLGPAKAAADDGISAKAAAATVAKASVEDVKMAVERVGGKAVGGGGGNSSGAAGTKKKYITDGRVDYVSLLNSRNPKKLISKSRGIKKR
ncbi:hypothetical protein HDU76_002095 [Blyttiomyces sp. JEL0837]|nr:hypothetical protein HDU76_002095 [Blyttiomyces sp. JEL0837]